MKTFLKFCVGGLAGLVLLAIILAAIENPHVLLVVMLGLVILFVYFIPTMLAAERQHINATAIFLLNLFLGWTFLGWVAALVWVFVRQGSSQTEE